MKIRRISLCIVLAFSACRKDYPFEAGADSIESLVSRLTNAMTENDHEKIRSLMIRRNEYVNGIHPFTPEGKEIGGEEYWKTFIVRRRDALTQEHIKMLSGKKCQAKVAGTGSKRESYGPVTFYRQTPVRIECTEKGKLLLRETRGLLGIVVEKNGVFKLLNIFTD